MTGTQADILNRLKAVLPVGWFTTDTPILDAVLNGIASALALVYSQVSYAALQTRIRTATDGFLDLISFDYFGSTLARNTAETDASFRTRILAALFPERGTRNGIIKALTLLTGRAPWIFEPANIIDTGSYCTNNIGYSVAGGYGSLVMHQQAFVTAYRPSNSGIPNIAGYGFPQGAYSTASQAEYASLSQIVGYVTDAALYAAVDAAKPAGSAVWVNLSN